MISVPSISADPTRVEMVIHRDGRFIIQRIRSDGSAEVNEFNFSNSVNIGPLLVTLAASPGNDSERALALVNAGLVPPAPYFEIEIRRKA